MTGNGVSLTRLLRNCSLALIQFFDKAKKWADMNNLNETFVKKIEKLNRNFVVSHVIFKKFQPIFLHLFKDPALNPPRVKTSRKQKRGPCSTTDVFDFCWTLFVRVKSEFSGISDDLVNSYHLLLSCVDYVHANAVIGKLKLINNQINITFTFNTAICWNKNTFRTSRSLKKSCPTIYIKPLDEGGGGG